MGRTRLRQLLNSLRSIGDQVGDPQRGCDMQRLHEDLFHMKIEVSPIDSARCSLVWQTERL